MGKSKKPRKAYKQVVSRVGLPITFGMNPEVKVELALAPFMAITLFLNGSGDEDLAYTIINSILIGFYLTLAEDDREVIFLGSEAMKRVLLRGHGGGWGFSGDDLKEIRAAITLSDELQAAATLRQMRTAVNAVIAHAIYEPEVIVEMTRC